MDRNDMDRMSADRSACTHDREIAEARESREHEEPVSCDRRQFLGSSLAGAAAVITAPAWLPRVSYAGPSGPQRDTLVVIFLRGGADGLSLSQAASASRQTAASSRDPLDRVRPVSPCGPPLPSSRS